MMYYLLISSLIFVMIEAQGIVVNVVWDHNYVAKCVNFAGVLISTVHINILIILSNRDSLYCNVSYSSYLRQGKNHSRVHANHYTDIA